MARYSRKQPQPRPKKSHRPQLLKGAVSVPVPPTARTFGYARVSTEEQNLDVQTAALRGAGVEEQDLFVEKISAVNAKRPMFNLLLKLLERGDTLLFHALSRIGREVPQIHAILEGLMREGIAWRSLTEPHLDATTATGRLMLNVTGAMAQFERDQIRERTSRGMQERKRQGMYLGRPRLVSPEDAKTMRHLRKRKVDVRDIAQRFDVKASTVYSYTGPKKKLG